MQQELELISEHIRNEAERARALRVIGILLDSGAFQEGNFKFNSGIDSPMRIEVNKLRANPDLHSEVSGFLAGVIKSEAPGSRPIVGVISGGVSFATEVGRLLRARSAARLGNTSGIEKVRQVKGNIHSGDRLVIVEDVVTTGSNTLMCQKYVESEGGRVALVVSIFSYGFDAVKREYESQGIKYVTLSGFQGLVEVLQWRAAAGCVNPGTTERLVSWQKRVNSMLNKERECEPFMSRMNLFSDPFSRLV